ncbi:MAG: RNA polymerase sigma factor [Polyangiaceae bacterium]
MGVPAKSQRPKLRVIRGAGPSAQERLSDDQIVAGVERGDPSVGDALFNRLIRVVDSTLYKVVGRRSDDHDDLVQQVFEQVVRTLREHRFRRACSLSSWAGAIAVNVAMNAVRKYHSERRVFDFGVEAERVEVPRSEQPDTSADARRELERLRVALTQVASEQAETVLLHDLMGKELAEIAVLMGVSIAAAQSRLVRGRKQIAARMRVLRGEA